LTIHGLGFPLMAKASGNLDAMINDLAVGWKISIFV